MNKQEENAKFTKEELEIIIDKYGKSVDSKYELFFETIKMNSQGRFVDIQNACEWCDASSKLLFFLLSMLRAIDPTDDQKMTRDLVNKIVRQLTGIFDET